MRIEYAPNKYLCLEVGQEILYPKLSSPLSWAGYQEKDFGCANVSGSDFTVWEFKGKVRVTAVAIKETMELGTLMRICYLAE